MEPEGSLPLLQEPTTCPYPEVPVNICAKNNSCWNMSFFLSLQQMSVWGFHVCHKTSSFSPHKQCVQFQNFWFCLNIQTGTFALTAVSQSLGLNKPKSLSVSAGSESTWNRLPVDSGQDVRVQSTVPRDHLYLSLWIFGCWNTQSRCCCQIRSMSH